MTQDVIHKPLTGTWSVLETPGLPELVIEQTGTQREICKVRLAIVNNALTAQQYKIAEAIAVLPELLTEIRDMLAHDDLMATRKARFGRLLERL